MRLTPQPVDPSALEGQDAYLRAYREDHDDPPPAIKDATPKEIGAFLDSLTSRGMGPGDAGRAVAAYWQTTPAELLRVCVLECAHEQWTDGELLALVERLAPLADQAPRTALLMLHPEAVRTRHLARGELRTQAWSMLYATSLVFHEGEAMYIPDNKTRWAAVKELHRQYAGWTAHGMAEELQDEIEKIEREGPDLPEEQATH